MSETVAIVAGSEVAASTGLPSHYGLDITDLRGSRYKNALSATSYGNYLPDFWQFAKERALESLKVEPGPIHKAIASTDWTIITQNIGRIHKRAGDNQLIEVYGSLFLGKCLRCQNEFEIDGDFYNSLDDGDVPFCPKCGKQRTRPSISLPGEKEQNRKLANSILSSINTVVYLGVEENSGPVTTWYQKVPNSVLVSEKQWGSFSVHFDMSLTEWVEKGMPIHNI